MKILVSCGISLAVLLIVASAHSPQRGSHTFHRQCQMKHEISDEELYALFEFTDYENLERKFKCHAHCLMEHSHYFETDGSINIMHLMLQEALDVEQLFLVELCREENNAVNDHCEYGFNILACVRRIKNEINIFDIAPGYINEMA